jgi:prepilin signal peptidase PulO-like enzyme (type II secretory pathway)
MDHAMEGGLWSAVSSLEGEVDQIGQRLEEHDKRIARVQTRDRMKFALVLLLGFVAARVLNTMDRYEARMADQERAGAYHYDAGCKV